MDLIELSKSFLFEKALILLPVLLIIGQMLKKTPRLPDWLIPWLLLLLGIGGGLAVVGLSVDGVLQGILLAGLAVFSNQLWKQTKNSKES